MKRFFIIIACILLILWTNTSIAQHKLPSTHQPQLRFRHVQVKDGWDKPEKPAKLPYHTFDIRYLDGTEDRVTGIIEKIGHEYMIMKSSKASSVGEKQIKMSDLTYVEIIDDIENTLVGIKLDSVWLFPSVSGIVTAYSTYEGRVKSDLTVNAIQKNLGPIYRYSPEILDSMISDNVEAKKFLLRGRPLAAINVYNDGLRESLSDLPLESSNDSDTSTLDSEPRFIGGKISWQKYLKNNLKYPFKAKRKNIQQNVHVSFLVDSNGVPQDIKVVNGNTLFHEEAIRLIKESGKWLPAIQDGQYVQAATIQMIPFVLKARFTTTYSY